jgi:hypothetical protein
MRASFGSVIIHHFAIKSPFFMSLGACRLKKRILVLVVGLWAVLNFSSCGGYSKPKDPPSGLPDRVLASQGVSSTFSRGGLVILNGYNDTIPGLAPIPAGNSPGVMAISPSRNIAATFDAGSSNVYAVDTFKETDIGNVRIPGPTLSMAFPTAQPIGYAAIPTATVNGYTFVGAVDILDFVRSQLTTIAVTNAQTVIANSNGTQLLVFSNDSDSITVLTPANAVSPVDLSCQSAPNAVCTQVPGFDRPVWAVVSGNTAYIMNCGAECGGVQASVQTLDLSSLAVSPPVLVNGATIGLISGSQLFVAGNGTPTGPLCTTIPSAAPTAATYCGILDIVDLNTMTDPYYNNPSAEIAIPDGFHWRIDMTTNGQVFVGSLHCTNIGNVNNPVGEVRGCLAIYRTANNSVVFPPDNGDVNGLQGFTTRDVEYVAEGGNLRVYDTLTDVLLINDFLPAGNINVVGYVGDIKAIDFF